MTDRPASPPDATDAHPFDRVLRAAVVVLAVALVALTIARVARSWPREAHLSYAEGIWLGLATDAAHHTFYRPLDGPLGYGGTRYFPLFFLLIAGLIRAGLDPIVAGYYVAAGSVALLLAGTIFYLRNAGASSLLAGVAACVVLSCQPVQMALLTIRGDGLPAALTLLGLACCLPRSRLSLAPIFFSLAFAAKPTSLYGVAAAVLTLAMTERRDDAWRVAWRTLAGMATVVALMVMGSGGRVIDIFAASAAGGSGLSSLLSAPLSLARMLRRVPESTFFIQLAAASLIVGVHRRLSIERAAFLVCAMTTLAIYASPATVENHLIDLSVISVVVLACWAARDPRWTRAALAIALVGGMSSASTAFWRFQTEDVVDVRSTRLDVIKAISEVRAPLLVVQPMIAAERAESPYLLDPYIFSLRIAKDPAVLDHLLADVGHRHFGAIVLEQTSLDLALADSFPGPAADRFRTAVDAAYRLDEIVDGRPIYLPKP